MVCYSMVRHVFACALANETALLRADAQAVAELHKEVSGLREMKHEYDDLKHLAEDLARQVAALKAQIRSAPATDHGTRYLITGKNRRS